VVALSVVLASSRASPSLRREWTNNKQKLKSVRGVSNQWSSKVNPFTSAQPKQTFGKETNNMKQSMLRKQLSRARTSLKRRVRTTLVRIPYFDAYLKDGNRGDKYDQILTASFDARLYSDVTQLQINEIEINRNCNLDCVMCNTSLSQRPQRNMDLELFENVVATTKSMGQKRVSLHTIGEPLLNPMLEEYFKI
jgi:sulfatase maturation enzyme AslB (radical SAM superfamily)